MTQENQEQREFITTHTHKKEEKKNEEHKNGKHHPQYVINK